jgi:predicted dehydrogenase
MRETIRIGIIGVGYWGPNLVRNFSEIEESELVWVCDLSEPRLEYISRKWPGINTTKNYEDILGDSSIDAVVIATPVETHFDIAMAALNAGKHVFIEKPMTYRAEEDMALLQLAEKKGLKIGTGHIFIYHPAVIKMRDIIKEQKIGKPYYAYSIRMNPAPSHGNVEVIWDLAVHDVSIALYLWDQIPKKVRASGDAFAHDGRVDVATIELYFSDNTMSYHHVGWLTSAKERSFFLAGSKGSMKFDDTLDEKLQITGPAVDTRKDVSAQKGHIFYAPGKTEVAKLSNDEPLKKECEDFVHAVLNGRLMESDGFLGHSVVRVLEAASFSVSNGGEMIVLKKEL